MGHLTDDQKLQAAILAEQESQISAVLYIQHRLRYLDIYYSDMSCLKILIEIQSLLK